MRPYVIINGVNSNTINGLLVQSLPPISKPQMRTTIEEIAGRDGDIVTTTGFKAYDKTMSVGLYGDYNTDEIIDYLSQSGEIVFSNEPDKYYKFACYAKADYERLIRFKTANITYHIQPYKYDFTEKLIDLNNENDRGLKITVINKGNTISRPNIIFTGSGIIRLYINEIMVLILRLTGLTTVILGADGNTRDINGAFLNRRVEGDLSDIVLNKGANVVSLRGNVTNIKISEFSRWL